MPRPKSLNRDREICRDLEILSFLDSSSRSRSRSKWIFAYFLSRFLNSARLYFHTQNVSIMSRFLDKSWFVSTISTILTKILTRQSLDWKVLILKISTKTNKKFVSTVKKFLTGFKSLSRQIQKSQSWLVLTVKTPRLTNTY
jgi:hypothetical protein